MNANTESMGLRKSIDEVDRLSFSFCNVLHFLCVDTPPLRLLS